MANEHTFTLFPKLPPELRNMVWRFAASEPRVVKIFSERPNPKDWTSTIADHQIYSDSRQHIPPILQATSESRRVALKFYTPAFASRIGYPIYFNFSYDILYLTSSIVFGFSCDDIRHSHPENEIDEKKVRHLTIAKDWLSPLYTLYPWAALFPNPETLVVEDEKDFEIDFWLGLWG
jgi:hypothetical protein